MVSERELEYWEAKQVSKENVTLALAIDKDLEDLTSKEERCLNTYRSESYKKRYLSELAAFEAAVNLEKLETREWLGVRDIIARCVSQKICHRMAINQFPFSPKDVESLRNTDATDPMNRFRNSLLKSPGRW